MSDRDQKINFAKEYQERFEKKLKEQEIATLDYWKTQIDKLIAMKPDGVASLQVQIKKISEMMANRIKVLKRD